MKTTTKLTAVSLTTLLLVLLISKGSLRINGAETKEATIETREEVEVSEQSSIQQVAELISEDGILNDLPIKEEERSTYASAKYLEYSDLHNVNYDENSDVPMFRDLDIIETSDNTVTVTTYNQMRDAILDVNISYIYMGADIKLAAGGVKIPYAKKYLRISGKDPVTGEIHTLEEATSSTTSTTANIHVSNTTSQKEPTSYGLEDVNLNAHNYYGTINVNDNSYYVHLIQTNVNYDGPQPTHNLNGTNDYHNYKADIYQGKPNTAQGQELAEAHFINIFGNFELYHDGAHSIAWFGYGNNVKGVPGHFKIKEDAVVKIRSTGRSFFYFERTDSYFTVEKNAFVDIEAGGGLVRQDIASSGTSIKDLIVGENAELKITRTKSKNAADNRLPTLSLSGDISVSPGARLYMNNESDSSGSADQFITFRSSSAQLDINQAKSILFYNPKGKILNGAANNNVGHFNSEVESMSLWESLPTSQFILTPDNIFSFPDKSNISFNADVKRISASNHQTTILSANPLEITSQVLDFNKLKVISMGVVPSLQVDEITDMASEITGKATEDGTVVATYNDGEGEKKLTALVAPNGQYVIDIPERASGGKYIKPYTQVQMEIFYDYRTAPIQTYEVKDVTPPEAEPVRTIIEKDTAAIDFPEASKLVTKVWDKSFETSQPKLTIDYHTAELPDLTVVGPVLPQFEVAVTDEGKNQLIVKVPIFIKDEFTKISKEKEYALRGKDIVVKTIDYPKTNAELINYIQKHAELQGWLIDSGAEIETSAIKIEQGTLPQPDELTSLVDVGEHTVTFSYAQDNVLLTREINFKIIPSTAKLTIQFLDEEKSEIAPKITKDIDIGSLVDLSLDQEIKNTIKLLEDKKYRLIQRPEKETEIEILAEGTVVAYQFAGTIRLTSAPTGIDFGKVSITDFQKKIGVDETNMLTPLVVEDNRKSKSKWDVTAQVEKEMTNGDDVQIGALKYIVNQKELTLNGSVQRIYFNDSSSDETIFNISNSWRKNDVSEGLKLKIESDRVPKTTGSYEGIIRWTLRDTIE